MIANSKKLRVGVSIHLRQGQQSIWENGIFQNCAFLVELLNQSPLVKRAVLVNGGDALVASDTMMLAGSGLGVIGLTEALQTLDVVVEMSALLPEDWMLAFRQKGGRVVWMRVGNDYVIDMERAMSTSPLQRCATPRHTMPSGHFLSTNALAPTISRSPRVPPFASCPTFGRRTFLKKALPVCPNP
jgi:Protein of unknown function (DUF2827)